MLRVLIIEDDADKFRGLAKCLRANFRSVEIEQARSLNSGLRRIESIGRFHLLLLDMSLPTFDVGRRQSSGGIPQTLGGQDILDVLDAEGKEIPTILVTRYGKFTEGSTTFDLPDVDKGFAERYEWYLGFVHYSAVTDAWQKRLLEMIRHKFPLEH